MSQPNILWILTDQHAPDISGFAGDPVVRTQNLDTLAARSVQFENAVCSSPVCTASRMSMLTGKEPHHCSAWNNHWIIFPEHLTWPGHFADNGYRTCLVGKMHLGGRNQMAGFQYRPYGDLRHGVGHQPEPMKYFPGYPFVRSAGETEIPESLLQDVVVSREALAFVLEHNDKQPDIPWFLCASYTRPHYPLTAPGRYIRYYRDKVPAVEVPPDYIGRLDAYGQYLIGRQTPGNLTEEENLRGREAYYANVDFVDDCIGELLNGLERAGLLDNTIIIYTADHGEMAGKHGLWGKTIYYKESMRVPLLITGPGIASGHHVANHIISLMDLFPTTCALAGLSIPEGLDGIDMSKVLSQPDTEEEPRPYAPSAYYTYGVRVAGAVGADEDTPCVAWRAVRDRQWKYVDVEKGKPLLFDMINDPKEEKNISQEPEYSEVCKKMKQILFTGFSWEQIHKQLKADRERLPEFFSGQKPTTPNQYMLPDGRIFDAEAALYEARWLYFSPEHATGGIIPQQFG